ncbi:hypothetical protein ETAA8_29040 [Anatilimnocola aggregata]|uniref:Uncharacterized protein n=1 Tax=Anatilimnocola aggregata TaxID=2528021 RepID=A0A517YC40_9BACT|nr:hypothetical protein ETAA8_29040 [Anatilimnocola aggregata]
MLYITFSAACLIIVLACATSRIAIRPTVHQLCGWKAADYFADPQVIKLCQAIEADDIAEIDRLVAAGADVNARGKDNMTPLFWA